MLTYEIVPHPKILNAQLPLKDLPESVDDSIVKDVPVGEVEHPELPGEEDEVVLETLEQNPYEVLYTCLLLPKLRSNLLLDEVANQLQEVMMQVSSSFGWYLEFQSIRPEYLLWTVRVNPSVSTTYIIHVYREETSRKIFEKFPDFADENQSDDFWAPGYLIISGLHPHPIEVIKRYIQLTRRQQGNSVDE